MSLTTNLTLSALGLTTVGGIIGGGYALLKDNPRNIDEFLEVKQRILLTKGSEDTEAWNANWATYIQDNTPTPRLGSEEAVQTIDQSKNIWNLSDYAQEKNKPQAPESFKNECLKRASGKFSGIWESKFKEIEKYCTKAKSTDD